jgi:hypothetical protein
MKTFPTLAAALLLVALAGPAEGQQVAEPRPVDPSSVGFWIVIPGIEQAAALEEDGEDAALGSAVIEQRASGNRVEESGIGHTSRVENSFLGNQGLVSLNQDSGNMNNQANLRVFAFAGGDAQVTLPGVELSASSSDNEILSSGGMPHTDAIIGSFNDTAGIVGVNQSSGSLNQQANVVAIAVGLRASPEVAILDERDLDGVMPQASDEATEPSEPRSESLVDSFSNFRGIAQVSQAAGNENSISNVIGISVNVMGPP